MQQNKLKICEIFGSIQGEGVSTGVPVVFVRFGGCNLKCIYCDTKYTWDWNNTKEMDDMNIIEIYDEIHKKVGSTKNRVNTVVLTGGEPLIQQKSKTFLALLRLLKVYRFRIEVETNGTIVPLPKVDELIDQYNVSIKLGNSGVSPKQRIKENACKFFNVSSKTWFKFVIVDKDDIKEVQELQKRFGIAPEKILLMPEGRTNKQIKQRAQMLVNVCLENGYRFCNRLHVWLWDNKRGV